MSKKELLEDLGRIITKIRKKKLMSQAALGEATDSSQMTIQRIESGSGGRTRLETLFGISEAFDVPLKNIFMELERDSVEDQSESFSQRLDRKMKQLSPSKKEWISEIVLKIIEGQIHE